MQFFFLGIVVLLVGAFVLRGFANTDPRKLAKFIKRFGGVAAIALGGFMTMRGLAIVGFPVMAAGWAMFRGGFGLSGLSGMWANRTKKTQGQQSCVRTAMLEMELDHDSGEMDGTVLDGSFKGERLSKMSAEKLRTLHREWREMGDPQSVDLLAAYMHRMRSEWFGAEEHRAAGEEAAARGGGPAMTREQAFGILGLEPGASEKEIKSAHRALMLKLHPDHGGSTYLAAKINEAKDFLLGA